MKTNETMDEFLASNPYGQKHSVPIKEERHSAKDNDGTPAIDNQYFDQIAEMDEAAKSIRLFDNAVVFIDLEGCLINSWLDRTIMPELKPLIDKLDDIKLFTFAIFGDQDMSEFEKNIKPEIEEFFNKPISLVESRSNLIPILNGDEHNGRHIEPTELSDFYTKSEAFRTYISNKYKSGKYILIDDSAVDSTLFLNDSRLIIHTVSFKTLANSFGRI